MPALSADLDPNRRVLRFEGKDAQSFLQGLVTNDVSHLADGPVYAALLSPQGKFLADFLLVQDGDTVLMDLDAEAAQGVAQRLGMYKLRADVQIGDAGLHVLRGVGAPPEGAFADPRHPALGWRMLCADVPELSPSGTDWDALHVTHVIPRFGAELIANDSYILEHGFKRLNGVDFRKGCYVGQEVTARMHHKTTLKKGLRRVAVSGPADSGTEILSGGKPAGILHSRAGDLALAYLRFDRAEGEMRAGEASVTLADPEL